MSLGCSSNGCLKVSFLHFARDNEDWRVGVSWVPSLGVWYGKILGWKWFEGIHFDCLLKLLINNDYNFELPISVFIRQFVENFWNLSLDFWFLRLIFWNSTFNSKHPHLIRTSVEFSIFKGSDIFLYRKNNILKTLLM